MTDDRPSSPGPDGPPAEAVPQTSAPAAAEPTAAPEPAVPASSAPDKTPAQAGGAHTVDEAEDALKAFEQEQTELAERESARKKERAQTEQDKLQKREAQRRPGLVRGFFKGFFQIRDEPSIWGKLLMAGLGLGTLFLLWYLASREWWGPEGNERALNKMAMGSPEEVFGSLHSLWFERAFMRNLLASLWRVFQGFGLAVLVGVPLGIIGGTFKRVDAFFMPISIFGRNVPIAALVPLTMLFFGIDEGQKIAFIFVSCVAFVMFDASRAIADVKDDYLDTAYTLGASRWQVLTKVLIPLAMPDIVNSLRLMLGLAFGYIVLAEMVNAEFGVGKLILTSQRRGPKEHVYLVLFGLTLVAFAINYLLVAFQRVVFRYKYGGR
jgi:ABC-type nitrate/sulfonate/bicarbonate transport system permease component